MPLRPPYDPQVAPFAELAPVDDRPAAVDSRRIAGYVAEGRAELALMEPSEVVRGRPIDHEVYFVPHSAHPDGIRLSVFRPRGSRDPLPCVYNIHGGGLTRGDALTGLDVVSPWIERRGVAVVTVDYGLAPERSGAGPAEDCYAGLLWMVGHAAETGIDPARVILHGMSAGGALAAATALMAGDRGGPSLLGMMLRSPMLDDRSNSLSCTQYTDAPGWSRISNLWAWRALLGDARGDEDWFTYAVPGRAADLSALPPVFVDVGSAEPLRDEAIEFATRLWEVGNEAELHVWSGGSHMFVLTVPDADVSVAARAAADNWLGRVLTRKAER